MNCVISDDESEDEVDVAFAPNFVGSFSISAETDDEITQKYEEAEVAEDTSEEEHLAKKLRLPHIRRRFGQRHQAPKLEAQLVQRIARQMRSLNRSDRRKMVEKALADRSISLLDLLSEHVAKLRRFVKGKYEPAYHIVLQSQKMQTLEIESVVSICVVVVVVVVVKLIIWQRWML